MFRMELLNAIKINFITSAQCTERFSKTRGKVVGIATGCELNDRGIAVRVPVG
jgi:hypothetical protein